MTPLFSTSEAGAKKLNYIFAYGRDGCLDVSRRYSKDVSKLKRDMFNSEAIVQRMFTIVSSNQEEENMADIFPLTTLGSQGVAVPGEVEKARRDREVYLSSRKDREEKELQALVKKYASG